MNAKLKKYIFNKLYEDLSGVEIIPYKNSIWFIDRDKKYWYLRYEKNGELWWRYSFFPEFFHLFSMEELEFQWVISEWVEEVLNCKVETPMRIFKNIQKAVEEVLNCKVETPVGGDTTTSQKVEEVLNCKVETPNLIGQSLYLKVEEVLNCKVKIPYSDFSGNGLWVEDVLKQTIS